MTPIKPPAMTVPPIRGYHDFLTYDDANHPIFATLVLRGCRICKDGSITEQVFPDVTQFNRPEPLFYLDIPYPDFLSAWEFCDSRPLSSTPFFIPWRTVKRDCYVDLSCLLYNPKLNRPPHAKVVYCTIKPSPHLHLRLSNADNATHLLVHSQFNVNSHPFSSFDYEQARSHCDPAYLDHIREGFGALFYRHVLSAISPYGVDYWVVPRTKSPA